MKTTVVKIKKGFRMKNKRKLLLVSFMLFSVLFCNFAAAYESGGLPNITEEDESIVYTCYLNDIASRFPAAWESVRDGIAFDESGGVVMEKENLQKVTDFTKKYGNYYDCLYVLCDEDTQPVMDELASLPCFSRVEAIIPQTSSDGQNFIYRCTVKNDTSGSGSDSAGMRDFELRRLSDYNSAYQTLSNTSFVKEIRRDYVDKSQNPFSVFEIFVGDVNADHRIGADDARAILRMSVGLDSVRDNMDVMLADLDGDHSVSSGDARKALRIAVGLEEEADKVLLYAIGEQ